MIELQQCTVYVYVNIALWRHACNLFKRPLWSWSYGSWIYNYLCNQCQSPLTLWIWIPLIARCTVLNTTLCDKVCQWLATDQWFSPGIPVSSTNKTDPYDITKILLKVALYTLTSNAPVNFHAYFIRLTILFKCTSTLLFTGGTFIYNFMIMLYNTH